ncbi:helix-turn-helix domain-containing protein [Actinoplanes couchii]|uniref:helix-turn-helix domain-containing protein n=1 Tax=Actinoplanes couchii TaxID=403638 RepID=UPI001945AB5B|nr:helix-turn-helix transcriptional regulator [Actinoplanes couchii]MDR6318060.1 transcriptional regulator with XRE-family HTH domain [Actinoplanes couchii]
MRNRELGALLKGFREAKGLTAAQVAKDVGLSPAVISRLETASRTSPRSGAANVRALCSFYGLDAPTTERLVQLAREGSQPGWWQRFDLEEPTATYLDLETAALSIDTFESWIAPGLLQTREYASEVIQLLRSHLSAEQLTETLESRIQRGRILTGENPLIFHPVIDESVLHRSVGTRRILRDQLIHLRKAAALPNVTVQVLPFSAGINDGTNGPFSIMNFAEELMPPVVHSEGQLGQLFEDDPRVVGRVRQAFTALTAAALTPEESLNLIDERIRALT